MASKLVEWLSAGSIFAATAAGGWTLGRVHLKDRLENLKALEKLELPKLVGSLETAAREASLSLGDREDYLRLRTQFPEMEIERKKLAEELSLIRQRLELSESKLKEFEGDTFTIKAPGTHVIVANRLALGITSISDYNSSAYYQLGSKSGFIDLGESVTEVVDNSTFTVILLSVNGREARFSVHQREEKDQQD